MSTNYERPDRMSVEDYEIIENLNERMDTLLEIQDDILKEYKNSPPVIKTVEKLIKDFKEKLSEFVEITHEHEYIIDSVCNIDQKWVKLFIDFIDYDGGLLVYNPGNRFYKIFDEMPKCVEEYFTKKVFYKSNGYHDYDDASYYDMISWQISWKR